jgi:hypothetical protein
MVLSTVMVIICLHITGSNVVRLHDFTLFLYQNRLNRRTYSLPEAYTKSCISRRHLSRDPMMCISMREKLTPIYIYNMLESEFEIHTSIRSSEVELDSQTPFFFVYFKFRHKNPTKPLSRKLRKVTKHTYIFH